MSCLLFGEFGALNLLHVVSTYHTTIVLCNTRRGVQDDFHFAFFDKCVFVNRRLHILSLHASPEHRRLCAVTVCPCFLSSFSPPSLTQRSVALYLVSWVTVSVSSVSLCTQFYLLRTPFAAPFLVMCNFVIKDLTLNELLAVISVHSEKTIRLRSKFRL